MSGLAAFILAVALAAWWGVAILEVRESRIPLKTQPVQPWPSAGYNELRSKHFDGDIRSTLRAEAVESPWLASLWKTLEVFAFLLGILGAAFIGIAGLMDPGIVKGAIIGRLSGRHPKLAAATPANAGQQPFDEKALQTLPQAEQQAIRLCLQHPSLWTDVTSKPQDGESGSEAKSDKLEKDVAATAVVSTSTPRRAALADRLRQSLSPRRRIAVALDWTKTPYTVPDSLRGAVLFDASRPDALLVNEYKFCRTCRIWRPPRAAHDTGLDVCVLQHDHFCSLIGNSVGEYNHPVFAIAAVCATGGTGLAALLLLCNAIAGTAAAMSATQGLALLLTPSWAVVAVALCLLLFGRPLALLLWPVGAAAGAVLGGGVLALVIAAGALLRAAGVPLHRWMLNAIAGGVRAPGIHQGGKPSCKSGGSCSDKGGKSSCKSGGSCNGKGAAAPRDEMSPAMNGREAVSSPLDDSSDSGLVSRANHNGHGLTPDHEGEVHESSRGGHKCKHAHGTTASDQASSRASVPSWVRTAVTNYVQATDPSLPGRMLHQASQQGLQLLRGASRYGLIRYGLGFACFVASMIGLFWMLPVWSVSASTMYECYAGVRAGFEEASQAAEYSQAKLLFLPEWAAPVAVTETSVLWTNDTAVDSRAQVSMLSGPASRAGTPWMLIPVNSSLSHLGDPVTQSETAVRLVSDSMIQPITEASPFGRPVHGSTRHGWSGILPAADQALVASPGTIAIMRRLPLSGPQSAVFAVQQWIGRSAGRGLLAAAGVVFTLAVLLLAAQGMASLQSSAGSIPILAGGRLTAASFRKAAMAMSGQGSRFSPCPTGIGTQTATAEVAAAVIGVLLGARMLFPRLVCFDLDGARGLDHCPQMDGGWAWLALVGMLGACAASFPFAISHPCMVLKGQVTRDMAGRHSASAATGSG